MKTLVEGIARALVDRPEEVNVRELQGEHYTLLELRTHPLDLGKVIGRSGRTVNAMRTLLGAVGKKLNKRFMLDIVEEGSNRDNSNPSSEHSREGQPTSVKGVTSEANCI